MAQPGRPQFRPANALAMRALAALVALLLSTSSLAQVAHFWLIPHAICAEHGELLELPEGAHAQAEHPSDDHHTQASTSDEDGELSHDHCQQLARNQREHALPVATQLELAPAASAPAELAFAPSREAEHGLALLSVAPKTSPPAACG